MVTDDRPDAGASVDIHVDPERAPYEHALADAGFRARIGAGYTGAHDVLDALWWLEHPLDPAPSGATPPASLLDIARRVLYAPSATADAVGRYREAVGQEQLDRASLEAAVTAIDEREDDRTKALLGRTADASPPLQVAGATPDPVVRAPARPAEHRWQWATVGIAAALIVVALLGWARPVAEVAGDRTHAGQATPAAAGRTVLVEVQTTRGSSLPPFPAVAPHRARVLTQRLAVVGGTTVSASLTRLLVCLEVRTGIRASSTCGSRRQFSSGELEVPSPTGSPSIEKVVWLPDGRLRLWTVR